MWIDVRCDTPTRMGSCGRLLFRHIDASTGRIEIKCFKCKQVKDIPMSSLYHVTT